jgi:UDP-N-acetylmuramyl pentapeptide synthase
VKIETSEIAHILNGILKGPADIPVKEIIIDSRQLSYSEGLAFFAITGKNHDGHNYIDNLYQKGIRIFVVEKLPGNLEKYADTTFILVKNTVEALQTIAAHIRKAFKSPVIAVTGSAGKTVVKEWLADVLSSTLCNETR